MGLFGKSDKEKEQEAKAQHDEAQRKMQDALRKRQQEQAKAAPAPQPQAAQPQAAPKPGVPGVGGAPASNAAPKVTQVSATGGNSYTVKSGDSLSKIAKQHLGDANAWRQIYDANRGVIGDDPDKIYPGQELKLPARSGNVKA